MAVENSEVSSIYDLMALCCEVLLKDADNSDDFDFPDCDDDEYRDIEAFISDYNEMKITDGKKYALHRLLGKLTERLGGGCTREQAYKIVYAIDCEVRLEEPVTAEEGPFISYASLNAYKNDCVRIFPVLENDFLKRSNIKYSRETKSEYPLFRDPKPAWASDISSCFKNYIIMDQAYIQKYPIKIIRAKRNHTFFRRFANKNMIRIDLVPFTQVDLEETGNVKFGKNKFWLEGLDPLQEKRLLAKQENYLKQMKQESIDFIIFPEMFFTEKNVECSKKYANGHTIVVNGSIWDNHYNRSIVSLGNNDIMVHYKRCPFEYKKKVSAGEGKTKIVKYKEDIKVIGQNEDYNIMEIENFGRIGIGICRDLDYNETQNLWKMMNINLLLIPACTPSGDMEVSAKDLSESHNMIVVMGNACGAVHKQKDDKAKPENMEHPIGFVTLPGICGSARKSQVLYYSQNQSCDACERVCQGHTIEINLDRIIETEERVKTYAWSWK